MATLDRNSGIHVLLDDKFIKFKRKIRNFICIFISFFGW